MLSRSHPIYAPSYILLSQHENEFNMPSHLKVLANTASQQSLQQDFEMEDELEVWTRNANGPPPPSNSALRLYTPPPPPPPAYNPNPNAWDLVQAVQAPPIMASHGGQHHPYYTASPTSPTFNPYEGSTQGQNPGYPSSISSNDPLLTQEEADLKRLRNTAASARFRAKKKRREASLERNAREKKAKLDALEDRIRDLEAENQWLKDLIMEKNEVRNARMVAEGERKGYERKDGVGT